MQVPDYDAIVRQFPAEQNEMLRMFHALQDAHAQHYLPAEALAAVSAYLNVTRATVYGTASYYSLFSLKPRGHHIIRLCQSPVCAMLGSASLAEVLCRLLGVSPGETTEDGMFTLELVACLGQCAEAPALMVDDCVHSGLTAENLPGILEAYRMKFPEQPNAGVDHD